MWEWRWGVVGRMRSWFLGMSRGGMGKFWFVLVLFCFALVSWVGRRGEERGNGLWVHKSMSGKKGKKESQV